MVEATRRGVSIASEDLHRIVVVGGGAAGLELVTRLGDRLGRRSRARVTLVECARAHLWKPLLHEVAAGSLDPGQYEVSYLAQAHWHGFRCSVCRAAHGAARSPPALPPRLQKGCAQ
jgi:NADH dehydrogenase